MPDTTVTIDSLPAETSALQSDVLPIVSGGVTSQITVARLAAAIGAALAAVFDASGTAATLAGTAQAAAIAAAETFAANASNLSSGTVNISRLPLVGQDNGLATLDSGGHLTAAQIPAGLVGAMQLQGGWNANINSPALTSGAGTTGQFYKVTTAGTTSLDGVNSWNVGDLACFGLTTWFKVDGTTDEVISFNGRFGVVSPATNDYSFSQISGTASTGQIPDLSGTYDLAGSASAAAGDAQAAAISAAETYAAAQASAAQTAAISAAETFSANAGNISSGLLAVARGGTGIGTLSGLVKGNGTSAFSVAAAGTDYLAPSGSGVSLTGITAAQVGADASGTAATLATAAQSNAETYAASQASTAQSNAETYAAAQASAAQTAAISAAETFAANASNLSSGTVAVGLLPAVGVVAAIANGATITTNVSLGTVFQYTFATGGPAATMGVPIGTPFNGQKAIWKLVQNTDGNAGTLTWNTVFDWGTGNSAPTLTHAAGKIDYVAGVYDTLNSKWHMLPGSLGY